MKQEVKCKCGFLTLLARDPASEITRHADTGTIFFRVSDSRSIVIIFCPLCGGRDESKGPVGANCHCNGMAALAKEPQATVIYDQEMNEYRTPRSIVYYCLICGGRMPESKRRAMSTEVSKIEAREFFSRVKGLKTMEEVIAKLGNPDSIVDQAPLRKSTEKFYGTKTCIRQLAYTCHWKSLDAIVCLMEDGEVQISCSGKQKRQDGRGVTN